METITIPKEEYDRLKGFEAIIENIEEVIHKPELSDETKENLKKARATPKKEYISDEEIQKEFS